MRGERNPLLSGPVPHDFGEAFRSLRTALVAQAARRRTEDHRHDQRTAARGQDDDGRPTSAMALAVGGARVLLIDADMRRPNVHKTLRLNNDRGLSQLLAGQARMREVVQRTHDPESAGHHRRPHAVESVGAARRRSGCARSSRASRAGPFDWVIIDTPPVLAVTDAVIVAPLVAGVMFVIGAEMTRLAAGRARASRRFWPATRARSSAVLNKVDFQRNKYYYSRYYGHQYKNYYQEAPAA